MFSRRLLAAVLASPIFAGCATPPAHSADTDYYAPHIYRTGSNIPVKDYGAENMEVGTPIIANPAERVPKCGNSPQTRC